MRSVSTGDADYDALRRAANEFLDLRNELLTLGRIDEAQQLAARAAECYAVAGEDKLAAELIDAIDPRTLVSTARDSTSRRRLSKSVVQTSRAALCPVWGRPMRSAFSLRRSSPWRLTRRGPSRR